MINVNYTKEQIKDIAENYGKIRVRDCWAEKGQLIWWRCNEGPEQVLLLTNHLDNARLFPMLYQIEKPKMRVSIIYED